MAFRGLSGVNIPGGSWVLSMSRSAGRVAARCAFTRARGATFRTKAGGAKCDPSLDGEKSAKPPLRHRRSAGVACATVRGARGRGIERALRVLETTIPRASSVSRETSSAACEVRTAITRNSTRPPRALDVTTFFVDEDRRLLLRAFWVEPCAETPNVHVSPRRESPKIGGDIPYAHLVTRARKDAKRTRVDRCAFR